MLKRKYYPHAIIINSHICGLIGYLSPLKALFLLITPFNLILSSTILMFHQQDKNRAFWLFAFIVFSCGYLVEVSGIHTRLVFGHYSYGETLGFSLFEVPLVMGLNWLNLIYSVGIILNKLRLNVIFKSLIGASLLVSLDLFIEPVAMKYDFWNWHLDQIPVQNFVAWFIVSFLFLIYFFNAKFSKKNPLAWVYLVVQFVFFILLSFL